MEVGSGWGCTCTCTCMLKVDHICAYIYIRRLSARGFRDIQQQNRNGFTIDDSE